MTLLPFLLLLFQSAQDEQILERADKILEEAKAAYEIAREKNSVESFVDAGFKLEEARIKYFVLQEIGSPEKQRIAVDRLRAVNQLSKLIHDGKVAISGKPTDVPAPGAPPPSTPPPPVPANPADPPPAAPVDVTRRAPIPEVAKQKDAEKLVRELYKDQYAKKAAADRKALSRLLIEQAEKTRDDPASSWVLYREAQEVAVQVCDIKALLASIDGTARIFDVDAMTLKSTALAAAGKTAKAPEEFAGLADALDKLIEELVSVDLYDAADKAATAAAQHAKRANDAKLVARMTIRSKEIAEAKTRFQALKGVLETLAKTPDDPNANLEMGQFLCYVKGSWDLGIRFLQKGSDATLKGLVEKEQAAQQSADVVGLGESWEGLADKEKSPLRKAQMLAHARGLYERALPGATGLLRTKIEKKLEASAGSAVARTPAGPSGAALDLIPLIDPSKDTVTGTWKVGSKGLLCEQRLPWSKIQVPYEPPEEYDVTAVVERTEGIDAFCVGLISGTSQFCAMLDGFDATSSGLANVDNKVPANNESIYRGAVLKNNKATTIVCFVRKGGVTVKVDGKTIVDWKGTSDHLSNWDAAKVPNTKALYIAAYDCKYTISKLTLTPIRGEGKKSR